MKKLLPNQRGFAPVLIVLILAALAAGAGFLVYTNYSNNQTKTISSIPAQTQTSPTLQKTEEATNSDETTNWKTYTDTEFEFAFQYPSDWYIYSGSAQKQKALLGLHFAKKPVPSGGEPFVEDIVAFTIRIFSSPLNEFISNNPIFQRNNEEIMVDGKKGVKSTSTGGSLTGLAVMIDLNKNTLIFSGALKDNSENVLFYQILSTFKFLP